jgi:hypothetical protein
VSEGAAEGGAPLSDGQFGDGLTETGDIAGGETAQNPGDGIFAPGFYPWFVAQSAYYGPYRRKKKRDE